MKEHSKTPAAGRAGPDEILPEYDFSHSWPNKYAIRYSSPRKVAECKVELQGSVPLDAEAIFTLGFSDREARHQFITEMGDPNRRAVATATLH